MFDDFNAEPEVDYCPRCGALIEPRPQDSHSMANLKQTFLGEDDIGNLNVTIKPHCNIAQMDVEIDQMDTAIDRLRRQRAAAGRERNQYALVARLPVEMISEIFMWAFASSYAAEKDTVQATTLPLILGKVCYSWRRIAWGLSELWSLFHCRISKKRSSVQTALLEEWLDRSERRLLSIRISMEDEDAWTNSANASTEIIDILTLHCCRWRSVSLILPESWYDTLAQIKGKLNSLTKLSIRPPGHIFVLETLDVFSNAPRLQHIGSSHYYLHDLEFPWVQLTTATLGTASTDEALEFIRRCPNLTSCRFEDLNIMEGNFPADVVIHSNIQSLDVSFDLSATLTPFFVFLTLPNLCALALTLPETHANPIPAIESFMARSEYPLQKVQIKGPPLDEQDIITFLTYHNSINDVKNK